MEYFHKTFTKLNVNNMALGKSLGNILGNYFGEEQVTLNDHKLNSSNNNKANISITPNNISPKILTNKFKQQSFSTENHFPAENQTSSSGSSIVVRTDSTLNFVSSIKISEILPNPYQTRSFFDSDKITSLAANIKENGLIQPIVVLLHSTTTSNATRVQGEVKNNYTLLAGERRLRACKLLGWTSVLCVVKDVKELDSKHQCLLSIMENIQREDLSPIELSKTYEMLMKTQELSEIGVAQLVDKSPQYIKNYLRLLTLHLDVQNLLLLRKLNESQARHLVGIEPILQAKVARTIVEKDLTVKEVIRLIDNLSVSNNELMPIRSQQIDLPEYYINSSKKLADEIPNSRVKYFGNSRKGKIVISWIN